MSLASEEMLEGKHARRHGMPRRSPHPPSTRESRHWLQGWDDEDRFIRNRNLERQVGAAQHKEV